MTDATVNKDEMARLLDMSLPTFTSLMRKGMPIAVKGSQGVPYEFEPHAVIDWFKAEKEAAARAVAERSEFLQEFAFDETPEPQHSQITPAQRVQNARALEIERKMAREAGHLVPTAGIRQALHMALGPLGKRLDNLPSALGREFNLPDAVQRAMRRHIDDMRAQAVRDIQALLTNADAPAAADHLLAAE